MKSIRCTKGSLNIQVLFTISPPSPVLIPAESGGIFLKHNKAKNPTTKQMKTANPNIILPVMLTHASFDRQTCILQNGAGFIVVFISCIYL